MKSMYFQPEFRKASFTCPYCGVLSTHTWSSVTSSIYDTELFGLIFISTCNNSKCEESCLWIDEKMERPDKEGVQLPNDDLDEDIKTDYMEASSIVHKSPRGAAALLRLCIQKL